MTAFIYLAARKCLIANCKKDENVASMDPRDLEKDLIDDEYYEDCK